MWTEPARAILHAPLTNSAAISPTRRASDDAEDTLRALYAEHGPAVLAYAEGFTRDRGRAEDIVHETFLRAWRHLPRLLADDQPVRPWLLLVARRLLIDAARAARARPLLTEEDQAAGPAVDGGLEQLLDQTVLVEALRRLSPAHRQIVIEAFILETPMHLTAARLGVPAGTARSRLHYALAHLRRRLDPGCTAA
jgi:RNA polymerase sigma-70 factor, ECF subfamily